MKLFRFLLLCTFAVFLLALLQLPSEGVSALEAKGASKQPSGVGKVKCKEEVDKALRQYFDKDEDDKDDDEDDDDDDDNSNDANTNEDDDDDDDSEEKEVKKSAAADSDEDDDDDDNSKTDGKDDDDDDDEKSEEKSAEKSKDDDDDDDDDDDSKEEEEVAENAAKVRAKKATEPSAEDDDDDDDDDDDSEEEEEVPAKQSSTPLKGASAAPAGNKKAEPASKKESSSSSSKPSKPSSPSKSASKSSSPPAKSAAPKKVEEEEKDDDDDDEEEEEVSEEELAKQQHQQKRSRAHIDDVLKVYEIGSQDDNQEQNLILSIFRDLKRIYEQTVKPLETIYKYRQITTRLITDAEIFSKPMVLFLGGKSTGKSSLVNYLLGIDETPWEIKIGAASSGKFTILSYGDNYTRLSATELSADYTFSSLQRFGEQFINEYIDAHRLPINILQKMTIVDSPGLIDLLPAKAANKQTIDNDVYQWFIDRSDVIYIVIDVSQLHLSSSLRVLLDQLKGREVRFVISKSDIASQSQIISMIGQLLWVLSPIMSAEQPPMVYALTTLPAGEHFDEFLDSQETGWLRDLSYELSGISRIESHIAEVRRHAVRVRNHAKLVDCYLATFYRNKGLFTFGASSRQLALDISENPHQYRIYSGAIIGQLQNVSRYDLPDPGVYRDFFRSNPLIDFKPLSSTCSYFRGCPIDKLDVAIAYDLPELVGKYKKLTKAKLDSN